MASFSYDVYVFTQSDIVSTEPELMQFHSFPIFLDLPDGILQSKVEKQ
jgi:hypothetical protein